MDSQEVVTDKNEKTVRELVITEEERIKADDTGTRAFRKEILIFPVILLGAVVYSFGMNCFLRPLHLYSGE